MTTQSSTVITTTQEAEARNWLLVQPAFAESPYGRSLRAQPLGFIDIGARGGVSAIVEPIAAATAVLGFEPDANEAQALRDSHAAVPIWHTFEVSSTAVAGTKGPRDFYQTARGVNSSLLRPSEAFAERYQVPGFAVESVATYQTDTLDNIVFGKYANAPAYGEFLKIDVQGAEREVLQGAERLLGERTVAVVAEVSFCELYEHQPLFGEVAEFLKNHGFSFYGFHAMSHRASHLRYLREKQSPQWSQRLLHADAVFFRDDVFAGGGAEETRRSRAVLLGVSILLGHYDTAVELLSLDSPGQKESEVALMKLLEELATKGQRRK